MANKKEIIQWVTIQINMQINKKIKEVSTIDFDNVLAQIIEKNVKDVMYRYTIKKHMANNSGYDEELKIWIPKLSDEMLKLCEEAGIYDNVVKISDEVKTLYKNYKIEVDDTNTYNKKLRNLLASFKENMLLISNGDLADYAKAFVESIRE